MRRPGGVDVLIARGRVISIRLWRKPAGTLHLIRLRSLDTGGPAARVRRRVCARTLNAGVLILNRMVLLSFRFRSRNVLRALAELRRSSLRLRSRVVRGLYLARGHAILRMLDSKPRT